jgi:hypothetical protein
LRLPILIPIGKITNGDDFTAALGAIEASLT